MPTDLFSGVWRIKLARAWENVKENVRKWHLQSKGTGVTHKTCIACQGKRCLSKHCAFDTPTFYLVSHIVDHHGLISKTPKHQLLWHHGASGSQRSSGVLLKYGEAGEPTQRYSSLCLTRDVNTDFLCLQWILALGRWVSFLYKPKKWGWLLVMRSQNFNNALFLNKCA